MHAAAVLARSASASASAPPPRRARRLTRMPSSGGGRNSNFRTKKACGGSLKKLFRGATLDPARADVPARSNANDRVDVTV